MPNPKITLEEIQDWAAELGFSQIGVADVDLSDAEPGLLSWLANGFHGGMHYMKHHGVKRARPAELVPGTLSVITARMNYLPRSLSLPSEHSRGWQQKELARLSQQDTGIVSVYARGRDYHKVMRSRLQKLALRIEKTVGTYGYRVFTDSAPVLEVELASRSGQGWRGKHTLLLNRQAGSMFFLGEIYINFHLASTNANTTPGAHCGSCRACIDVCPTKAIVAPYKLDARRCISYLTIEHEGSIPQDLRAMIGNRIYGCDDCQLICPWNKYAVSSSLADFEERSSLVGQRLVDLFAWTEADFLRETEGTPIRRIGYERWSRNLAVAMGNAIKTSHRDAIKGSLVRRRDAASPLLQEHIDWALAQDHTDA